MYIKSCLELTFNFGFRKLFLMGVCGQMVKTFITFLDGLLLALKLIVSQNFTLFVNGVIIEDVCHSNLHRLGNIGELLILFNLE